MNSELTARLRMMETRTGSVGDCSKLLNYRNNSRQNLLRRRSTRRRISNAQRLADLEDFINRRVQASDNNFFERLTPPFDSEALRKDEDVPNIKGLSLNVDHRAQQDLYVEALYTICHRVGKDDSDTRESLYKYVQAAFQMDQNLHAALMEKCKTNKPPVVLLNVQLIEGRDLIAKDVNGFSDPFAMMGVVPGKRERSGSEVGDEENPRSPKIQLKKDVLQKFGGSFRRKVDRGKKTASKGAPDTGTIPAKLIKASSVQKKTLNPKWNEKFQFIVDDINADRFHIDIWDHDDEENSVLEAVSNLNQITGGLKGLGRYFKEVAQSARANSEESSDDFLGCVTFSLNDLPPEGIEKFFVLQPRSEKSKVSGSIKMKVWLSTKEERLSGNDDDLLDVKEHIGLTRQFAVHEIRQSGMAVKAWDGHFSEKANTILRQHAVQGDLTEIHTAMCRWLALNSLIPHDISFTVLAEALQKVVDRWQPMALDKEEEDMLSDSLAAFDSQCKKMMIGHRHYFPPAKRNSADEFASLIRCMKCLRESPFYQKYLPFKRPFQAHLESLIVKSAEEFFDDTVDEVQDPDPCKELLRLLARINSVCAKFMHYSALVREVSRIDYSQLTLSTLDRMLSEYLTSEMMSEKKTDLRTQMRISANQDPPNEDDLVDLIRIHMAFVELRNYRLANRVRVRDESEWYGIFNRGIKKFFDLIKEKALARITLSCQLDVPISTSSSDIRHTSSHIDVCHIVEQITVCWERMDVNDVKLKVDYTKHLVELLCEVVMTYTQKILTNLESEGLAGELQVFVPSQLLQLLCSTINNCEQVRRSLHVHEKLHLDDLAAAVERVGEVNPEWRSEIEGLLESTDENICAEIDRIVNLLTKRLMSQMKKHVFHLAWSPAAQPVEESLKPLTDMLDVELSMVHKNLLHRNFLRVMSSQVAIVVQLLKECIDENPGMEPTFYHRLFEAWHVLVDFFHAGGKGLSTDVLETSPEHIRLVKMLSLNQTPTAQLIEKYYKDLLRQQNEVSECKYGILNVRAYYNVSSQTLVLDVIGAKQVIPLDSNGLSDPFVVIELVPKLRYPNAPVLKTKVVSKSLNPIFDETFEFNIPPKLPVCAMLHFTVMDHDYLRSNDFAGEAYLELSDVPGFSAAGGNTLRQFNLILIQPVQNCKDIMEVLTNRREDKEAAEFLRTVNATY